MPDARPKWRTLSNDQLVRLVSIVSVEHGRQLSRQAFNEAVLACLEDLAGFETIVQYTKLLNILWRRYKER